MMEPRAQTPGTIQMQPCPVEVCARQCPVDKLMCPEHWRLVPQKVQLELNQAWYARRRDPTPIDAVRTHQRIKQTAIDLVDQKLAYKAQSGTSADQQGSLF